jgi:putative endonuclease
MSVITAETEGYLYILCFDRPLGNPDNRRAMASHYLGWCLDVPSRVAMHAAGAGSALTQAVVAQGIGWEVYYRLGTPGLERRLKSTYKDTPCLCPRCATRRGRRPSYGFQSLAQLAITFRASDLPEDFPAPPKDRMDWLEGQILRGWRASRPVAAASAGDDDLL